MQAETIENIWHHTKCIDLLKGQNIIEIDSEASVSEGCEILVKNGITSAPVFSKTLNCYVGMLDYRDIVDYVLLVFHKKSLSPISEEESLEIAQIVEKAQAGESVTAQAVSDLSHKNPFYSVMLESPLSAAIDILATDNGVHRINVVDGNGRVRGILSQTDVIKFLLSKAHLFTETMKSSLEAVKLGCGPVVSVNAESSVLNALERMSEYYISSVAVVEPDGTLIGNISMADIRFIFQHGRYHRLWMNCSQFVSLALNQKGLEHGGNDQFPFFDAHLNSTVEQVMNKILATHVHRVWVTEPRSQRLIGVVSMTDLVRLFFERSFESIEEEDFERARDSKSHNPMIIES